MVLLQGFMVLPDEVLASGASCVYKYWTYFCQPVCNILAHNNSCLGFSLFSAFRT